MPDHVRAGEVVTRLRRWAAKEGPLRWWIWSHVSRLPWVCPAGAHSRIVWAIRDADPWVNRACRQDFTANTSCWCGKLCKEAKADA